MRKQYVVFVICVCLLAASWRSIDRWIHRDDPTYVVRIKYDALSRKDQNAYLDTIVPETRGNAATINSLASGLATAFIQLDPFNINRGDWMSFVADVTITYDKMEYSIVEQSDEHALVKASGKLTVAPIAEYHFCMYQDVQKVNGQWNNDEYSQKRILRLQDMMQQKIQKLKELEQSSGVDSLLGSSKLAMLANPVLWNVLFDYC